MSNFIKLAESFPNMQKTLCGKSRNCSLRAIYPCPKVLLQTCKNQGLFGKWLDWSQPFMGLLHANGIDQDQTVQIMQFNTGSSVYGQDPPRTKAPLTQPP